MANRFNIDFSFKKLKKAGAIFIPLVTCLLVLHACTTAQQTRNKSPYFDGLLKFNDKPVAQARIFLSLDSRDSLCHKPALSTTTNSQGQFSLKPARETSSYTPFLNYQLDEWVVCAEYNNQRVTLYTNNRYDAGSVSESLYLDCDLASRPLSKPCDVRH